MTPKVILVDMDGTLSQGVSWTPADCKKAKPIEKMIKKVNQVYLTNFIIIYTARRDELIPATLEWLRRNNVRYHAISNLKCGAEIYIDDKMMSIDDFLIM